MFMSLGNSSESTKDAPELEPEAKLQLFNSEYNFAKSALRFLNQNQTALALEFNDEKQIIRLTASDDLKHKFKAYPSEIYPDNGDFILTADKEAYMEEVKRSRNDENAWPKHHYLWRKHPVLEWLQERMLGNTGRHQALVLGLHNGLNDNESIFMVSALIPNRKAHPVIWQWYGVHTQNGQVSKIEPLAETLKTYANHLNQMPNTAQPVNLEKLNLLKTPVIDAVVEKAILEKRAFDEKMQPQLHEQLEQLEKLKTKQETQMELDLGNKLISVQQSQRLKKQKYIDKVFAEYQTWVEDTWQTEAVPYIQLIAVLAPTKQEQK
jgi:hypothetical protein